MTAALVVIASASVWISLGTVAVINGETMARIAAVPAWWSLGVLVTAGAMAAAVLPLSVRQAWPFSLTLLLWLPYLPGEIPAAFLIWQGPLEVAVWLAVIGGVLASAGTLSFPKGLGADPQRAPWLAAALLGFVSLAAFGSVRQVLPGGDEPHYLVITQSLMLDGDLRIEDNHARGDYLSYFTGRLRPDFMRRGADGQIYSIHSPGVSALILPGFAAAGYLGAVLTIVLMAMLASAMTWRVAWLLSASVSGAWIGWAAVFLSSPFLFQAFTIYPDGPAAMLVIAAAGLLVSLELGRPISQRTVWLVSAGLAALPWLHTRFAVIAAAVGLCLFARLAARADRRRYLTAMLVVPSAAAVMWFGYFWLIWKTPNPAAPYGADSGAALAYIARGFTGLLVDQQFGLLPAAPVYAVAIVGVLMLARTHPRLAGELAVVTVPYLIVTSSYAMWWGGISSPARFLTALMPLAALPIAAWWPRQSAASRTITVLLLMISVLAVWPRAFVDGGRLLYSDRSGYDLTMGWAAQLIDLPLAFPSVHRDAIGGVWRDAAVWLAAGAVMVAMARAAARVANAGLWTVTVWAAAMGLMGGSTVVWARHGERSVTPSRSQISTLTAVRDGWPSVFVRLRPFRVLAPDEFLRQSAFSTADRLPPRAGDPALFRAASIPAGEYEVLFAGETPGEYTAVLGRNDSPVERWSFDPQASNQVVATLRLPVDVAALTIRGDGRADPSAAGLRLRATSVNAPANGDGRRAVRAARYGRSRLFAFDERVYLEPSGLWTRADGEAIVVIDSDGAQDVLGRPLLVRAGAVATSLELVVGEWSTRLTLAAGQQETVQLPPLDGARSWTLIVRSGPGFRPSALDPASTDVRQLAVWMELP